MEVQGEVTANESCGEKNINVSQHITLEKTEWKKKARTQASDNQDRWFLSFGHGELSNVDGELNYNKLVGLVRARNR